MKKIVVVLCMLLLISCGGASEAPSTAPTAAPEPVQKAVVTAEPKEAPPAPVDTPEEEPVSDLSPELAYLIGLADQKLKNIKGKSGGYEFLSAPPPENLARDKWYIKGNKITIKLYEENVVQLDLNYDTVYIDTSTKKVVAYCEDERSPRCPDSTREFVIDYEDVMIKTPYQWLKEIDHGEIVGSELLWDRKVEVVEYQVGKTTYKQWLDGFSGLPVKVMTEYQGQDPVYYEFRNMAINSVRDEILEH